MSPPRPRDSSALPPSDAPRCSVPNGDRTTPPPPPRAADPAAPAGSGLEVLSAGRRQPLPEDCVAALPSETHAVLLREAAVEAWPRAAALRGELRGQPAWSRALPPGLRPALPLLPDGFVAPRPPFYTALPGAVPLRALALGHEHVVGLGAAGEVYGWGGGR